MVIWILGLIGVGLLTLSAPIATALSGLIREQINKIKHENLKDAARNLVAWAEQELVALSGDEKFEQVFAKLETRFKWASPLKIKEFIEATVLELHQKLAQ